MALRVRRIIILKNKPNSPMAQWINNNALPKTKLLSSIILTLNSIPKTKNDLFLIPKYPHFTTTHPIKSPTTQDIYAHLTYKTKIFKLTIGQQELKKKFTKPLNIIYHHTHKSKYIRPQVSSFVSGLFLSILPIDRRKLCNLCSNSLSQHHLFYKCPYMNKVKPPITPQPIPTNIKQVLWHYSTWITYTKCDHENDFHNYKLKLHNKYINEAAVP